MFPEYPFESRWFEIDGHRLHYLDEGPRDGEVVVMLHGNPTWSFYYRNLVAEWREKHRCIVPDHLGMGLSDKPQDYPYTVGKHTQNLDALLRQLDVGDRLTFVCHDWGGMIGSAWMTRHAHRVARLVLMNTAGFRIPPRKTWPWQLLLARAPLIGALLVRGLNAFCRGATRACMSRREMPPQIADAYVAPYDSWANRVAIHAFVKDIPIEPGDEAYDLVRETEAGLAGLKGKPTLLVWGMRDFVFDHHFLHRWQKYLPQAEVRRIDDGGHYILEDAPELVIPKLSEFLEAHPLERQEAAGL